MSRVDNNWSNAEWLVGDERDRSVLLEEFADWEGFYNPFQKLFVAKSKGLVACHSFHEGRDKFDKNLDSWVGDRAWKDLAFDRFSYSILYSSIKSAMVIGLAESLSYEELTGLCWRRFREASKRLLDVKGSVVRGGEKGSLEDYFVEQVCLAEGWDANKPSVVEKVTTNFYRVLANSVAGMTGEFRVYCKLVDKFGEDCVRFADKDEEGTDVDLYLFDEPISVKCHNGFHKNTFDKKRYVEGKDIPKAYVGVSDWSVDRDKILVAWPGGNRAAGYSFEDIDSLERLRSAVAVEKKATAYAVGNEVYLSDGRVIKKWSSWTPADYLDDLDEVVDSCFE